MKKIDWGKCLECDYGPIHVLPSDIVGCTYVVCNGVDENPSHIQPHKVLKDVKYVVDSETGKPMASTLNCNFNVRNVLTERERAIEIIDRDLPIHYSTSQAVDALIKAGLIDDE